MANNPDLEKYDISDHSTKAYINGNQVFFQHLKPSEAVTEEQAQDDVRELLADVLANSSEIFQVQFLYQPTNLWKQGKRFTTLAEFNAVGKPDISGWYLHNDEIDETHFQMVTDIIIKKWNS